MVGLLFGEAERRKDAHHILPCDACEDVAFVEELLADGRDGLIELDANHETAATHLFDAVALGHIVQEVFADGGRVLLEILVTIDIGDGYCSSHAEVVAAESGAEHAFDGLELRTDEDTAYGEAIGYALGHGDEVGLDAGSLMGEESTSASVATLDLIEDENRAMSMAEGEEVLEELIVGDIDTAATLDALDDDGRNIVFLNVLGDGGDVVQLSPKNLVLEVERGVDFRIVGDGNSSAGTAVEAVAESDDLATTSMERREFEAVLVGLGSAVADEEAIFREPAQLANLLGESRLEGIDDAIGIEGDVVELVGYRLYVARVAVTYGDYGMTAVEVEVFISLVVPYLAALGFDGDDIEERVYIEKVHGLSGFWGRVRSRMA